MEFVTTPFVCAMLDFALREAWFILGPVALNSSDT
jgi:hypothetical protein